MKIESLREFVLLSETLNFTTASKRLFLSQSTLSKHIRELEEEMGDRLLERTSHEVVLTPAGVAAKEGFEKVLALYDSTLREVRKSAQGLQGRVSIGVYHHCLDRYAYPLVDIMAKLYPNVEVALRSGRAVELFEMLRTGYVDVIMNLRPSVEGMERTASVPVGAEGAIAIMRPDHSLAEKEELFWSDLDGEDLIIGPEDDDYSDLFLKVCEKYHITPKSTMKIKQVVMIPYEIRRTGFIVTPMDSASTENYGDLVVKPIVDSKDEFQVFLIWSEDNANPCIPIVLDAWKRIART